MTTDQPVLYAQLPSWVTQVQAPNGVVVISTRTEAGAHARPAPVTVQPVDVAAAIDRICGRLR